MHNLYRGYTGAIHVYGRDFVGGARTQWDPATLEERPFDYEMARREFERANRASGKAPTAL